MDAELSTAGASSREPKLTKDSPSEEIWGRVEDELGGPPQWKPRVVIPSADETVSAERDPAEEAAGQPAWAESAVWAEPAAWAERPGWPDGADHADEPFVVIEREDTDPADRAGTAQASTAPAQDTNGAQHVAPAATAAAGDAAANRWSLKPALNAADAERDHGASIQEASDQEASPEAAPDHGEAAPDGDGAGPEHAEAVLDRNGAAPDQGEAVLDQGEAALDQGEAAPDGDGTGPEPLKRCWTAMVRAGRRRTVSDGGVLRRTTPTRCLTARCRAGWRRDRAGAC